MESNTTVLNSCFNLMRRLSPNDIKKNVAGLAALIQNDDLRYEVIQKIDQPLEVEMDTVAHQEFLKCEYNRDGDSYRSPWTNKYFPQSGSDDAVYPSNELLQLEQQFNKYCDICLQIYKQQKANDVFSRYAQLYFDYALTIFVSVYFFDTDFGFGACFLVKKDIEQSKGIKAGNWDSIHVVSVNLEEKKAKYRVVSTVFLKMFSTNPQSYGDLEIAGNLSRSKEETYNLDSKSGDDFILLIIHKFDEFHLSNIGRLIEANETEIRQEMDGIYINKTKHIINTGRLREEYMTPDEKINFQRELQEAMNQMKIDGKRKQ